MLFKRATLRYGQTPEAITPYQKAAQVWDNRIGQAVQAAGAWRLFGIISSLTCLGLSGGIVWLACQNRVTPYVVEVDQSGEVRAVSPALQHYSPTDAQIAWFLARFITNLRSLSSDPVLVRRNWLEAYDFVSKRALSFLSNEAQAHDPFADLGERTVSVTITSVIRASPASFQVKWTERTYRSGILSDTSDWTAILTVRQTLPDRADLLRKNPLGLYIEDMAWSQDFAAKGNAAAALPLSSSPSHLPATPEEPMK